MGEDPTETTSDQESGDRPSPWPWILGAVVAAVALRLLVAIVVSDGYAPVNDAVDFHRNATSLAEAGRWPDTLLPGVEGPTAFRAPAYPLLLAGLYEVVGPSQTAGLVLNAVLGGLAVLVIAGLATAIGGRRVGVAAAWMSALHPTLILFGSSIQLEPLLLITGYGALWCAVEQRRRPRAWSLAGTGLLSAAAVLTRETGIVFLVASAVLVVTDPRSRRLLPMRLAARRLALVGAAFVLVVAPWLVRNQRALGEPVAISTSPQIALLGTYNTESRELGDGAWIYLSEDLEAIIAEHGEEGEVAVSSEAGRRARRFALDNLDYLPSVVVRNTQRLFDLRGFSDSTTFARYMPYPAGLTRLAVLASWAVGIVAALGLLRGPARRIPWPLWLVPILSIPAIVLVLGMIRYRAVFEPLVVIAAACQLAAWLPLGPWTRPARH